MTLTKEGNAVRQLNDKLAAQARDAYIFLTEFRDETVNQATASEHGAKVMTRLRLHLASMCSISRFLSNLTFAETHKTHCTSLSTLTFVSAAGFRNRLGPPSTGKFDDYGEVQGDRGYVEEGRCSM